MSLHILVGALAVVGMCLALGLRGHGAKRVARMYGLGIILSLGGCVGTLGWLGAETSGRNNLFHEVNPLVWSGLFFAGIVILVVTSIIVIAMRFRATQDLED